MIEIKLYKELLMDLVAKVNLQVKDRIEGVQMGVHEGHLQKKLKDREGVWLCSNFPDAELRGEFDNYEEQNKVVLFLVEKVPSGKWTDDQELEHYARLQRIMGAVKQALLASELACTELKADKGMRTEWEYDIFGGFNGLSLGLNMTDYDTTLH